MTYNIIDVLQNHFGVDVNRFSAHYEIISRDKDAENFQVMKDLYSKHLSSHPLKNEIIKRLFIGEDVIIHLHHVFSKEEIEGINSESVFYYPICTIDEIKRIENPRSGDDYLLMLRAEEIANNARIARIFFSRMSKFNGEWSLSSYYDGYEFSEYIEKLPDSSATICKNVAAGFVLSNQPNGACIKSKFGKVIVVSEALRYFLYYMNVFAHHRNFELDFDDGVAALFIAIRTMLKTEALDFDIDPRGELPGLMHNYCTTVTDEQLQFVIGHEYAHLLLGHLGEDTLLSPVGNVFGAFQAFENTVYYTPRQQQEFDADYGSIMHADYSAKERARMLNGATLFFLYLDLFYSVSDYINPSIRGVKTHPDPIERIWALRKSVLSNSNIETDDLYSDKDILDWIEYFDVVKEKLRTNILPYHIDDLESYSSIYFRSRGEVGKIDRLDF
jgi:hypothetical protein